jgi:hypothetical protein
MTHFERKLLPNGKKNPKYIDLCDEDPPIAGQKFACLSFVSPDKILKKRETYLFNKFVEQWDMNKSMTKFFDFIHFLSYKYNLNVENVIKDYNEFIKEEEPRLKNLSSVEDDYSTFLDKNEDRLNTEFNKEHSFQTSVRGFKIRGSYASQEEAEMQCKKLRERDPNHDIFVGPVGVWVPWDPDAYKTGRVEFLEEELNQLHKEKLANEERAKQNFEQRVKETKKKAIEDNIRLAEKSGNVLTQTIDENGNLVGVQETVDFDSREAAETDTTNVRKELYESMLNRDKNTKEPGPETA